MQNQNHPACLLLSSLPPLTAVFPTCPPPLFPCRRWQGKFNDEARTRPLRPSRLPIPPPFAAACLSSPLSAVRRLPSTALFLPPSALRRLQDKFKDEAESLEDPSALAASSIPSKIDSGMTLEGIYNPSLHLVQCTCGSCGTKKYGLSEWERHTGCRAKKWKHSVKVKGSNIPLEKWMTEYNVHICNPTRLDKQQLYAFLKENYQPVHAKWTTERCAICRWVEDWDYNKIIICNRCQIAVHQECYGERNTKYFASWVCRACETPELERECCLCPVKG